MKDSPTFDSATSGKAISGGFGIVAELLIDDETFIQANMNTTEIVCERNINKFKNWHWKRLNYYNAASDKLT